MDTRTDRPTERSTERPTDPPIHYRNEEMMIHSIGLADSKIPLIREMIASGS